MTTYTATFHTDAHWSRREFDAATPEEALALARRYADEDPGRLDFEPYDLDPINEITIKDDDGNELTVWQNDDVRLRLAAAPMLDALRHALAALNTAPRFKVPGLATDSYAIAALCERAIRLATPAGQPMTSPFRCIDSGRPMTVARSDFRRITRADAWSDIPWRDDAEDADGRDDYRIGLQAEATFLIPLGNHFVIQTITSPGLWGIDADSDDSYLDEVFAEECDNLAVMLQALGVVVTS